MVDSATHAFVELFAVDCKASSLVHRGVRLNYLHLSARASSLVDRGIFQRTMQHLKFLGGLTRTRLIKQKSSTPKDMFNSGK